MTRLDRSGNEHPLRKVKRRQKARPAPMPGASAKAAGGRAEPANLRPDRSPGPSADRRDIASAVALALLVMAVFAIPLVVYLKVDVVAPAYRDHWPTPVVFDFFAYYKARAAQGLALPLAGLVGWRLIKGGVSRIDRPFGLLLVYIVLTTLSALASDHKDVAFMGYYERYEGMLTLASYAVLALAAATFVRSAAQARWVVCGWLAGMAVVMVVALMQFLGMNPFASIEVMQTLMPAPVAFLAPQLSLGPPYWVYATLANPNYVAFTMALVVPVCTLLFVLDWPGMKPSWLFVLTLLACATLVASGGRGAWVAVAASLPVALLTGFVVGRRPSMPRLAGVLLAAGLVIAACYSTGRVRAPVEGYQARVPQTEPARAAGVPERSPGQPSMSAVPPDATAPDNSADAWERAISRFGAAGSGRGYIWLRSVQMVSAAGWVGHGPDTFAIVFDNHDPLKKHYPGRDTFIDKPHNTLLLVAVNQGLPALAAYLGFIGWQLIASARRIGRGASTKDSDALHLALQTGLCAFFVASMFYDSSVCTVVPFWIFLGMLGNVGRSGWR